VHQESNRNAFKTAFRTDSTHRTYSYTTQTDSMSIGSRLTKEEVEQLTKLHNKARSDVGVGPLKWSSELASYAQEWADRLASESCKVEHRPHSGKWLQKHGENLFIGPAGFYGVADAVKAWGSERVFYKGSVLNYSNWYSSGHYTQMVWSNTKHLGCAKGECDGNIIVVCNYDPPGNVLGQKPY
jgi:pathogenesis-related protein 1